MRKCCPSCFAGGTAYDLVQPTDYMAEVMIKLEKLLLAARAVSKVTLLSKHIDPALAQAAARSRAALHGSLHEWNGRHCGEHRRGQGPRSPATSDVFQRQSMRVDLLTLNDNRELVTWALATQGISPNEITAENLPRRVPF
jgi:spermidine/putrescine-binding protein